MTLDDSEIHVEQHERQLLVSVSPREGVNLVVSVAPDVSQIEIEDALDEATKEVRHTRALSCVDGVERIDDIDPWEGPDREARADGGNRS